MQAIEEQIVLFLQNLFQMMGWPGVVIAMTIESACIPLPSEVTMPLAGWMLVQAQGLSQAFLLVAAFWGAVGNTLGSILTYWIGAVGGRPVLEKYGKYVLISKHDMDLADRWFARWGEPTAFFSRVARRAHIHLLTCWHRTDEFRAIYRAHLRRFVHLEWFTGVGRLCLGGALARSA